MQIAGRLQRIPLNLKNQNNLKQQFELADTLPLQLETYTVGILIGKDIIVT